MQIRLAYLKRAADGGLTHDGCQVVDKFDIDTLPRIGETVLLPEHLVEIIKACDPQIGIARRFDVVSIDYHWNEISQGIHVYIATGLGFHNAMQGVSR